MVTATCIALSPANLSRGKRLTVPGVVAGNVRLAVDLDATACDVDLFIVSARVNEVLNRKKLADI
jgi:hypothetical protein